MSPKKKNSQLISSSISLTSFAEAEALFKEKNYSLAKEKYLDPANEKNGIAKCALGLIAFHQENSNPQEAIQYFFQGLELGDSDCANNLAYCFENGVGVAEEPRYAIYYLSLAAVKGHKLAEQSLKEYLEIYGNHLAAQLIDADSTQYTTMIESIIGQFIPPQIFLASKLRKPEILKMIIGILRYAQKSMVEKNDKHAENILTVLFNYEFTLRGLKFDSEKKLISQTVITLTEGLKKYQTILARGRNPNAYYDSIIKAANINSLGPAQREEVLKEFLAELDKSELKLTGKTEISKRIKNTGNSITLNIISLLDEPNTFASRFLQVILPMLSINADVSREKLPFTPLNILSTMCILDKTIECLMQPSLSVQNAKRLITLLEYREKMLGFEVPETFFDSINKISDLPIKEPLMSLLYDLENVDFQHPNSPYGFTATMNRMLNVFELESRKHLEQSLGFLLTRLTIDLAKKIGTHQYHHKILGYRILMTRYMFVRYGIDPIVEILLKEKKEDLLDETKQREIFENKLFNSPVDKFKFVKSGEAIWFVTAFALTDSTLSLGELQAAFDERKEILTSVIEAYDNFLYEKNKSSTTSCLLIAQPASPKTTSATSELYAFNPRLNAK